MKSNRMARINELLRREIAEFLEKIQIESFKCLITVSEVKTSPDLRDARVYISIFGGNAKVQKEVMSFLEKHRYEFQKQIARNVILKYTPVLHFLIDERLEKGDNVLGILSNIEKENPS